MNDTQKAQKKKVVSTGSASYQIEQLEKKINLLQLHLEKNKTDKRKGNAKDIPAKRALLKKVAKMRRLIRYQETKFKKQLKQAKMN